MRFTVLWKPTAEAILARLWTEATDKGAVADASNAVDKLLSTSPLDVGESREGGVRILFVAPLGVLYAIFIQDRRIEVFAVWRIKNAGP